MRTFILPLFVISLVSLGCSGESDAPPTYPISGTVTYQGKPISQGNIGFTPTGSGPDFGLDIVDGKFSGEVGAGEMVVSIRASWETGEMEPGDAGSPDTPVMESIPGKYNENSDIKITVKESSNEGLEFNLE